MGGKRVDGLVRLLAENGSRRSALRHVLGGLIGGVAGHLGGEGALARCRAVGRGCERGERCCGGARCRRGKCRCTGDTKRCGRACIPMTNCCTDLDCSQDLHCTGGTCQVCPADPCLEPTNCGGTPGQPCTCRKGITGGTVCGGFGIVGANCSTDADCDQFYPGNGRCIVTCSGETACTSACTT